MPARKTSRKSRSPCKHGRKVGDRKGCKAKPGPKRRRRSVSVRSRKCKRGMKKGSRACKAKPGPKKSRKCKRGRKKGSKSCKRKPGPKKA